MDVKTCRSLDPKTVKALIAEANPSLTISPRCRGGLIISNAFFSDLIFPGSSLTISPNFHCKSLYLVGSVEFVGVISAQDRQRLWQNRIKGIQRVLRILEEPVGQERARQLINLLCQQFGLEAARQIPLEFIQQVGAVTTQETLLAWQQQGQGPAQLSLTCQPDDPALIVWQPSLPRLQQWSGDQAEFLGSELESAA
ncbi:MAG TPA: hypothetical protein IGR64_16255 [Leptolyngbyaceae cyanobacterium M65_K2018_010]|nr:hypothetical protein [Leptolyngbyaceae cyanobacterium M65_K2018_010]